MKAANTGGSTGPTDRTPSHMAFVYPLFCNFPNMPSSRDQTLKVYTQCASNENGSKNNGELPKNVLS